MGMKIDGLLVVCAQIVSIQNFAHTLVFGRGRVGLVGRQSEVFLPFVTSYRVSLGNLVLTRNSQVSWQNLQGALVIASGSSEGLKPS